MTSLSILVVLAAAAAAAGTEAVRRVALRRAILDVPNARSSHVVPTPRGGGVAIAAVVVFGWAVMALGSGSGVLSLALPAIAIAAISAVDDVRSLPARVRFGVHLGAAVALLAVVGGWGHVDVPYLGVMGIGWGGLLLGAFWLVGLTNAYNFMDGIDGIAGVQAVVAGTAWAALGAMLGAPAVMWTGGLVAGSALGFLWHNWSPARIFMGDIGSAFLGFVFAGLALLAGDGRVPLAALLFVWPFVFDAGFTFLRRLLNREDVFAAHRSHLYQRAAISGATHTAVAGLYGVLATITASSGLVWVHTGAPAAPLIGLLIPPTVLFVLVGAAERQSGPTQDRRTVYSGEGQAAEEPS